MAAAGLGSLAGVVLVLSVTHGFSKSLAGTFYATSSAFLIVETICSLGVTTGLVKKLPECLSRGRADHCSLTVVVALRPVLAVAVVVGAVVCAFAPGLGQAMSGPGAADDASRMLRTLAVFLPFAACNDALLAASRGLGTMRPTIFIENIGRLCLQPVAIAVVAFAGGGPTAVALAWAAPYLGALIVNFLWTRALLRQRLGAVSVPAPAPCFPRAGRARDYHGLRADFWRYTGPRAVATVVQTALKRSNVVLVAALTTASQAAIYATASRFVTFGLLGVAALQQALAPLVSKLLSSDSRGKAEWVFQTATVWMICLAWPIYLLSANFATPLLRIFGDGYDAGQQVVVLLSLAMLFATACGPVDSVLLMAGRSWLSLVNTTAALVLDVGLNIILIPRLGIVGAGISWALAIVVRNTLPLLQLRRYERLRPESPAAARLGLSCLALFGLVPFASRGAGLGPAWTVGLSCLGMVLYGFLLLGRPKLLGEMSVISALRGTGPEGSASSRDQVNAWQGEIRSRSRTSYP